MVLPSSPQFLLPRLNYLQQFYVYSDSHLHFLCLSSYAMTSWLFSSRHYLLTSYSGKWFNSSVLITVLPWLLFLFEFFPDVAFAYLPTVLENVSPSSFKIIRPRSLNLIHSFFSPGHNCVGVLWSTTSEQVVEIIWTKWQLEECKNVKQTANTRS